MNPTSEIKHRKKDKTASLFITFVIATLVGLILLTTFSVHAATKHTSSNKKTEVVMYTPLDLLVNSTQATEQSRSTGGGKNGGTNSSTQGQTAYSQHGDVALSPFSGTDIHKEGGIGNDDTYADYSKVIKRVEKRFLITAPDASNLNADEDSKLSFLVNINADGIIVGTPKVIRATSTCSDEQLINQVRNLVVQQARWNKAEGAPMTEQKINLVLKAH
ncbi:MAG: hypothetical protein IT221_06680 [Fluviicola sp.]|nr:hypothetical protein [Fluviicola sp.]